MSYELLGQIIVLCFVITFCLTWLVFSIMYVLVKYTDIGKEKKQQNKKNTKIINHEDDLPIQDNNLNAFSAPTIETSFGEERIGTVYKHEQK
jgi:predicted membrane protein|tara:strand:- start:1467 stop:1742 length:276 start_codon:yes stop_codon:yes gene_type:complete